MKIPYGNADFADIRRQGMFYIDKTPFLPVLEDARFGYKTLVFLRPRRMGKSSLVSMMSHYYDITRADEFDELFRGLWVHEHPTPDKNAHVVLAFNFGKVSGHDEKTIRESFRECILSTVSRVMPRIVDRTPALARFAQRMDTIVDPTGIVDGLMGILQGIDLRLYVMVDEYDTFANNLISVGSKDLYESLTEKTGFVRSFYRMLKAGVDVGGIARIFVTGVAPLLLDDLVTGFNIAQNITLEWRFHALAGFTRTDVEQALDAFLASRPELSQDPLLNNRETLLETLERHYNGYRLSDKTPERVFNSDMVLYFLNSVAQGGSYPAEMLDMNARTDYKKFYGLFQAASQQAEERREVLETVLNTGKIGGRLLKTFGTTPSPPAREQFISLLYYTGMLTLSVEPRIGWMSQFEIPNLVIRNLQWEHFNAILSETTGIGLESVPILNGQVEMATHANIEAFLRAIHERVMKVLGVKDLIRFDEKAIKMILITSAVISDVFHVLSEKEFAQGFCDLFMSPKINVPGGKYSWLIELKYLPTKATEKQIAQAFCDADAQVARYTSDKDLVPLLTKGHEMRTASVVFVGAKEIRCRVWSEGSANEIVVPANATATRAKKKRAAAKKAR